jgi:hypothetical protein
MAGSRFVCGSDLMVVAAALPRGTAASADSLPLCNSSGLLCHVRGARNCSPWTSTGVWLFREPVLPSHSQAMPPGDGSHSTLPHGRNDSSQISVKPLHSMPFSVRSWPESVWRSGSRLKGVLQQSPNGERRSSTARHLGPGWPESAD